MTRRPGHALLWLAACAVTLVLIGGIAALVLVTDWLMR
jgi:hypothetical protein